MNSHSFTSMKLSSLLLCVAVSAVAPLALGFGLVAYALATSAITLALVVNDYAERRPRYTVGLPVRYQAALPLAA